MFKYLTFLYKTKKKAVYALVLAFVGSLVAEVQSGATVEVKTLLLALGTAVVTSGVVHQATNEAQ